MSGSQDKDLAALDLTETETIQTLRRRPLTPNELAWIEFLRLASNDSDPGPTLARVQGLQRLFTG